MNKKKHADLIYYIVISAITCISMYWLIMINFGIPAQNAGIVLRCMIFVAFFIFVWLTKKRLCRIFIGITGTVVLIISSIMGVDIPKLLISLIVVLFMISITEIVGLTGMKFGNVKSLIIYYVLIAAVLMLMPVKNQPYDWKFFYDFLDKCENIIADISDKYNLVINNYDGLYNFNYIGYSEGADAGKGKLKDNNAVQITVGGEKINETSYLRGNICDDFTGTVWSSEEKERTLEYSIDTWISLYACFYFNENPEDILNYIKIRQQYVKFEDIKTKSIFAPLKSFELDSNSKTKIVNDGDNIRWKNIQRKNTGYYYIYMDMNYSNPKLQYVINHADEVEYTWEVWNKMTEYMRKNYGIKPDFNYTQFEKAALESSENIKNVYTQVSESLSDNAKNLCDEIIKNTIKNPASIMDTCINLNNFISHYTYNKNVDIPQNVNVIDYFLFDAKEGYCVQYATTLTQLLRYKGIPARFIEGFSFYDGNVKSNDAFKVTGNSAHAWVEAYIEGFGWILLDPVREFPEYVSGSFEDSLENNDETAEDFVDENLKDMPANNEVILRDNEPKSEVISKNETNHELYKIIVILVAAVVIFIIGICAVLLYRMVCIRFSRKPDVIINEIIRRFGKKYKKKMPDETIREYFERIGDIDGMDKNKVLKIIENYEYGGGYLSVDEIDYLRKVMAN